MVNSASPYWEMHYSFSKFGDGNGEWLEWIFWVQISKYGDELKMENGKKKIMAPLCQISNTWSCKAAFVQIVDPTGILQP